MPALIQEREQLVAVGGVRLAVREWPGPGRPVLLLHGLASTSHIWDLVAQRLARAFRVVAYDQRGHGRSSKPSWGYGYAMVTADAVGVIRSLRLTRPVVVGHSWGASVALQLAIRRPRSVPGVVLVDGGFLSLRDRMDWATARQVLAPPPLAGMPLEEFRAGLRHHVGQALEVTSEVESVLLSLVRVDRAGRIRPRLTLANHLRILRAMWEQDTPTLLRAVRVPTLVLGARSRTPSPQEEPYIQAKVEAARMVRAIGEPVRFEWIEGIHDVPLQRPEALARRIARFARKAVR